MTGFATPALLAVLAVSPALGRAPTFSLADQRDLSASVLRVIAADLDSDGDTDLATIEDRFFGEGFVNVILNAGDGSIQEVRVHQIAGAVGEGALIDLAAADMDADGDLDLVFSGVQGSAENPRIIRVMTNSGDATFGPIVETSVPAVSIFAPRMAIADFDADGLPDVVSGNGPLVAFNNPGLLINDIVPLDDFDDELALDAADLDGDEVPDIVYGGRVFRSNADRTFTELASTIGDRATQCVLADLDNDGDADLICNETLPGTGINIRIATNRGDASFDAPAGLEIEADAGSLAVADLNDDGVPDLIVGSRFTDRVTVLTGLGIVEGKARFAEPIVIQAKGATGPVATPDLNGDR